MIAKVDVYNVENFLKTVQDEKASANRMKETLSILTDIKEAIMEDVEQINEVLRECADALDVAATKEKRGEIDLQETAEQLLNTPSMISYEERIGTDEDGNPIYRTRYEPNPRYNDLQRRLRAINAELSDLRRLMQHLREQGALLEGTKALLMESASKIGEQKSEIAQACDSISNSSCSAEDKLEDAISTIREYLSIVVSV
jgi:chromosome segregation ATPase